MKNNLFLILPLALPLSKLLFPVTISHLKSCMASVNIQYIGYSFPPHLLDIREFVFALTVDGRLHVKNLVTLSLYDAKVTIYTPL